MTRTLPRVLPFAVFMAFIGLEEMLRAIASHGLIDLPSHLSLFLYPVKVVTVAAILFHYRHEYTEINWQNIKIVPTLMTSIGVGLLVFILWINMDWHWATIGTPSGYNPTLVSDSFTRTILIGLRVSGAALLVPVMEELFWRSWLPRYLISPDFSAVPLGRFTWSSFLISTALFGLEHNLWIAGMMAGAAYSLLLYRTRSLSHCIVAHGITNLLLALYVLQTDQWQFW